jgi:hypothetical protein
VRIEARQKIGKAVQGAAATCINHRRKKTG